MVLAHDSSIVQLQVWDTPPNFDVDQLEGGLKSFSTLVYVIDMQVRRGRCSGQTRLTRQQDDTYHEALYRFVTIMLKAYIANPGMKFAVFIHKAEMLSEDYRGGELIAYHRLDQKTTPRSSGPSKKTSKTFPITPSNLSTPTPIFPISLSPRQLQTTSWARRASK
jgi:hypothetical protein